MAHVPGCSQVDNVKEAFAPRKRSMATTGDGVHGLTKASVPPGHA